MLGLDTRFLSLAEVSARVKAREISPVELADFCFDLIDAIDGKLNSFIMPTRELAMSAAKLAEQELASGKDRGPLHGIPIALKDLYATKGIRTTANSKALADWVPDEDATTTRLLSEAGTVLLGKLTMHEFAAGSPGSDQPYPPARNPWNLDHQPGGSSSGSGAALAAGLIFGSLGSDTGGSIRGPAALCGIVGLKPTYGRVSRFGVVPLSWSLDHAGPMTRTVEDCALLLQAISGYDAKDAASADVAVPDFTATLEEGVRGMRLGVPREWFDELEGTNPEMMAAFETALKVFESQGARLVEIDSSPFISARGATMTISLTESAAYHEETLRTRPDDFGADFRDRIRQGSLFSAVDYIQAQRIRTKISAQIMEILGNVDVILSPTGAQPAEPFAVLDPDARNRMPSYMPVFNLTGMPAMSVPCGFTGSGLPLGLQIAGRAFDESSMLRVGRAYEKATPWHERHPEI